MKPFVDYLRSLYRRLTVQRPRIRAVFLEGHVDWLHRAYVKCLVTNNGPGSTSIWWEGLEVFLDGEWRATKTWNGSTSLEGFEPVSWESAGSHWQAAPLPLQPSSSLVFSIEGSCVFADKDFVSLMEKAGSVQARVSIRDTFGRHTTETFTLLLREYQG